MVPNSCQKASGLHGVPVPHMQTPALSLGSEAGSPPLAAPLLPSMPLSLPDFLPRDLPSLCPFLLLCPSCFLPLCSSVSPFSFSLAPPIYLSVFLSPAWALLSRTVWKVEKPSCGVGCGKAAAAKEGPGFTVACQVPWSSESRRKGLLGT